MTEPLVDHRRRRAKLTSRFAIASQLISVLVRVGSIPLAISILGQERYGAWLTLLALTAWFGMADIGVTSAVVNPLAAALAAGETARSRQLTSSSAYFLLVLAGCVAAALCLLLPIVEVEALLGLGARSSAPDVRTGVTVVLGLSIAAYFLQMADVICNSLQRGYVIAAASALAQLATLGGLVTLWAADSHSFTAATAVMALPPVIARASVLIAVNIKFKTISLNPRDVRSSSVREILSSGALFFVSGCGELLYSQGPNIIIAQLLGASSVPLFAIPFQLFLNTVILLSLLNAPLWPAVADARRMGDTSWIRSAYRRAQHRTAWNSVVVCVVLGLGAGKLISLWVGAAYSPPIWVNLLLSLHTFQYSMNYCAMIFMTGLGLIAERATTILFLGVVNTGLCVLLVGAYGAHGAFVAAAVSMLLCQTIVLPTILHRRAGFLFI